MARVIQFKRGNSDNFDSVELLAGEPAFLMDTGELFIGDGVNKIKIAMSDSEITAIVNTVLNNFIDTQLTDIIDARVEALCDCGGTTTFTYHLLTNGNSDNPSLLFADGDILIDIDNSITDYDTPITNGNSELPELLFIDGDILMSGLNYEFEYITNGNSDNPELLYVNGDILEMEVA
jgi:hypothetical protein